MTLKETDFSTRYTEPSLPPSGRALGSVYHNKDEINAWINTKCFQLSLTFNAGSVLICFNGLHPPSLQ